MLCYRVPGFTHTEVYNFPIHLRRFYIEEYTEWKKAENASADANASDQQQQAHDAYVMGQQNPE